jgi:hypothetical protein
MTSPTHGWAGRWPELLTAEPTAILARLEWFLPDAGAAQRAAWASELAVLRAEGAQLLVLHPPANEHTAVLEYMLPREAGRRPDVLVLQSGRVVVLEFKEYGQVRRVDIDQVRAYARDLADYHSACDGVDLVPGLVLCGAGAVERVVDGVRVIPAARLAATLVALNRDARGSIVDAGAFLAGEYAPMPTLVAAARMLFDNLPLPFIRRAQSAGVHDAVERVLALAREAREAGERRLVLVTGVPGAGKTLVGLQVAHHAALEEGFRFGPRKQKGAPATFLSGNGPLVQVLQDALKSRAFVQDMHRYIREYGLEHPERVPPERLVVFDEAQRAWDRPKIEDFYLRKAPHVPRERHRSEPQLLVNIGDRLGGWGLVLALVGEGQEIHTGEEAGMVQWAEALAQASGRWTVHGPAAHASLFATHGLPYTVELALNLDTSLRAQAASDLHHWVEHLLDHGDLDAARPIAERLRVAGFPIYVTRDLDAARGYVRGRFVGEPLRRYGLLASSKARNLDIHGVHPDFQATKRINVGAWFNESLASPRSCCGLEHVVTEFQCQGLELDLPIVCWGDDFGWQQRAWVSRPARKQALLRDPHRLRTNAYRVLLTRGREGLVVFVPPTGAMDATANALVRAGAVEVRPERAEQSA